MLGERVKKIEIQRIHVLSKTTVAGKDRIHWTRDYAK
jgi:hypothetical protein